MRLGKHYNIVFFICFIIICGIIVYSCGADIFVRIQKYLLLADRENLYRIIESIPTETISLQNMPIEMKNHIRVFRVPEIDNPTKKANHILKIFLEKYNEYEHYKNDHVIFDELSFSGGYFPTIHTDIEWNKIKNEGIQFWLLEKNENPGNIGNMFLFFNTHLYDKYNNAGIVLKARNNSIVVLSNTLIPHELETIPVDDFKRQTKKFYLNIMPNECIMFHKNVLHMSDYRTLSDKRKSLNFRVYRKGSHGKVIFSNNFNGFSRDLMI